MTFNEDSRVKIPTILHLIRLGYEYLPLKSQKWDLNTNIFPDLFQNAVLRINPNLQPDDADRFLEDVKLKLDNEDLGRAFFEQLTERSNIKLIDFENFNNNSFHVVTELPYKNGDEEFRPDITILINGMPLIFIEVKKPNNREGIIAERDRINRRFQNPKFRRFVNITQFMIFSNNMEYNDSDPEPIQGAFYASSSYFKPKFNYFREEEAFDLATLLKPLSEEDEANVLKDNNLEVIKNRPEFQTNKQPNRPTNRICTSLLSRERLAFILRFALVYVAEGTGLQKHIMRYPQLFATKAIEQKLNEGTNKGIIWHTQGSGKTALAYFNVHFLTDYFQKKNITPKFYFIVDRLSLLQQAHREFTARNLMVHTVNSRDEFTRDIKATQVIHNHSGQAEITVVNIQKFKDDPNVVSTNDYNIAIQRIYFLDEVHRSYNPKGCFLANLNQSDRNAIQIGLTGTPLLGDDYNSRTLFGDYIHKYYYNASIADGYTLRLIREEISTQYKLQLQQALEEAEVKMGDVDRQLIYAHPSFVTPMLDYIVNDFETSREALGNAEIGAMVICDSSNQAKQLFELFNTRYAKHPILPNKLDEPLTSDLKVADLGTVTYLSTKTELYKANSAALILHDIGTKEERKKWIEKFKAGKIDFLFVYNMLLTGFDAPRLKKIYLGRVVRRHNLLQALTRVNRTYKNFRYGYVVDFADISKEFEETNAAYFKELQSELGDEIEHYSQLFKSPEETNEEIESIKNALFQFNTDNLEEFSSQISQVQNREVVLAVKKALTDARNLYNLLRLQGDYEQLDKLDFKKLNILYYETSNHLDLLNLKQNLETGQDTNNLLNRALEDVVFKFVKLGEEELKLADELKNSMRQAREGLASNFDQKDPRFVTLKEELERLFREKKLNEVNQDGMAHNIATLNHIHERIKELNRENNQLRQKYDGDVKYVRIHKRLLEHQKKQNDLISSERKISAALRAVKQDVDEQVLNNSQLLDNESYFERQMMPLVIRRFKDEQQIHINASTSRYINQLVVAEYINTYSTGNQFR